MDWDLELELLDSVLDFIGCCSCSTVHTCSVVMNRSCVLPIPSAHWWKVYVCSIELESLYHHYKYFLFKSCPDLLSVLAKSANTLVLLYNWEMDKAEGGWLICPVPYGMSKAGSGLRNKQLLILNAVAGLWNQCFSAICFTFSFGIRKWSKEGHTKFQGSSHQHLDSYCIKKYIITHINL